MEVVEYARPSSWAIRIEIFRKGIMKPLGPVIKLMIERTETANVARHQSRRAIDERKG